MKNNAYFEELDRIGRDWTKMHEAHKELKKQIIDTKGWDSEELKAWYEEDEAVKFPLSSGACKACRAWESSVGYREDELEMSDFLWDKEVPDFLSTLREAGFTTFVYSNQSTAVMENLHQFAAAGWTMQGLCTIDRHENRWGREEPTAVMGIRISIG